MGHRMAKQYIAVRKGKVDNVVFVCHGVNACEWFSHVQPLAEAPGQQFKGFDDLERAVQFIGAPVTFAWRYEAEEMLASL